MGYNAQKKKDRKALRLKRKEKELLKKQLLEKERKEKLKQEQERKDILAKISKLEKELSSVNKSRKKDRKALRLKRKISELKKSLEETAQQKKTPQQKEKKKRKYPRDERSKREKEYKKPRNKEKPKKVKPPVKKKKILKTPIKEGKVLDWDKVYRIPTGYYMSIAYRDLTCEKSLNQILRKYSKMDIITLLKSLNRIVKKRPTYDYYLYKESNGKEGTSNGAAGKASFRIGNLIDVQSDRFAMKYETDAGRKRNEARVMKGKKPLFTHEGRYDYYQELTVDNTPFIKEFTPRNLLIVLTAIMNNITEIEREDFYSKVIMEFEIIMPEILEFLPN